MLYKFILFVVIIAAVESSSESCPDELSGNAIDTFKESQTATCTSCPTQSWRCGWKGGFCLAKDFQTQCHYFNQTLCKDDTCGCCFQCGGKCGNGGFCRHCCNAGEVESEDENCCKGADQGCKCCVPEEDPGNNCSVTATATVTTTLPPTTETITKTVTRHVVVTATPTIMSTCVHVATPTTTISTTRTFTSATTLTYSVKPTPTATNMHTFTATPMPM